MNNPKAAENLTPFKKGIVTNPKGRPKGSKSMSTILKTLMDVMIKNPKLLDQYETLFPEYFKNKKKGKKPRELIMLRLMTKALEGDLKAIDMIMDRTEGKVTQPIEGGLPTDGIIRINILQNNATDKPDTDSKS